jgi:hypothetical protein
MTTTPNEEGREERRLSRIKDLHKKLPYWAHTFLFGIFVGAALGYMALGVFMAKPKRSGIHLEYDGYLFLLETTAECAQLGPDGTVYRREALGDECRPNAMQTDEVTALLFEQEHLLRDECETLLEEQRQGMQESCDAQKEGSDTP